MVRPVAERLELGGRACSILRACVLAGLLQSEGVERLHDAVALLRLRPARQSAGRPVASPGETPEMSVHLQRRHMSDEVERMAHEVTVEDCDRRSSVSYHRMR